THMMAQVCGLEPGEFVWTGGDCHLYLNHLEQAKLQISREPLSLPNLKLNPEITEIDRFSYDDILIENYTHHEHISAPISV
ncbi:MAG: thymidylate synthase, partial [Candidatus Thermoplasmatota archaeon]|nr:thymidylate synthase [Candidatus Thermoplasmatota archaeon]